MVKTIQWPCMPYSKNTLELKECSRLPPTCQLSMRFPTERGNTKKAWLSSTGRPGLCFHSARKAAKLWDIIGWKRREKRKHREQRMSDRRKWGREKEEVGNAERKAIISQHQDAMTAVDRQGELQLIAELSSSLCTNSPSPHSLSLAIISLCT